VEETSQRPRSREDIMITLEVRDTHDGDWHPVAQIEDQNTIAKVKAYNDHLNDKFGWQRTRMVKPRVGFAPNGAPDIVEV
jgi:hypothetical protein